MSEREGADAVRRARELAIGLLQELETICQGGDALAELGAVMAGRAEMNADRIEAQIADTWKQVTSLPVRIEAMHKLSETMRALGMVKSADQSKER